MADKKSYVYAVDERIAYVKAFCPKPIVRRESEKDYDDIYLLIIDDEWFYLIFDYVDWTQEITENKRINRYTYILRENEKLNKRSDLNEIIYLIIIIKCGFNNIDSNEIGKFYEENIIYRGKEYKWMHY